MRDRRTERNSWACSFPLAGDVCLIDEFSHCIGNIDTFCNTDRLLRKLDLVEVGEHFTECCLRKIRRAGYCLLGLGETLRSCELSNVGQARLRGSDVGLAS